MVEKSNNNIEIGKPKKKWDVERIERLYDDDGFLFLIFFFSLSRYFWAVRKYKINNERAKSTMKKKRLHPHDRYHGKRSVAYKRYGISVGV